jgi:hypothetical protein
MDLRKTVWASIIGLGLFAGGIAVGQDGGLWARHPNLAQAERACHQADQYLLAAQQANHWDLHGHAKHAEELLSGADREIWAAARDADHQ